MQSQNANSIKNQTTRQFVLVLMVFVIGFTLQAVLNHSINAFMAGLDAKTKNAHVRGLIGESIVSSIYRIETSYYELFTATDRNHRLLIVQNIDENVRRVEELLKLLAEGGNFVHHFAVNLPEVTDYQDTYAYAPDNQVYSLSMIDIQPKLLTLKGLVQELMVELADLDQMVDSPHKIIDQIKKVRLQIKFAAPQFKRLVENAHRLHYESEQELHKLEKSVSAKKQRYQFMQVVLLVLILLLGVLSIYFLGRQVRKINQGLVESEDYVRDILDSQSNIIAITDGNHLLNVSGGFYSFFAQYQSLQDFRSQHKCICEKFLAEPGFFYRKTPDEDWVGALLASPQEVFKVKMLNAQGEAHIFQVHATKSARYQRFIISLFDITPLEATRVELETERERALQATQAKSSFLANMSHEIRTPLNAILGFIEILKEQVRNEEHLRYIKTIADSSLSLLGIINDILDFSKIESNKLDLDLHDFDPREAFLGTAELFKARCREKKISLLVNLDTSLPEMLHSDPLRIKQVLANLLSNAIKFTPEGRNVTLDISYDSQRQTLNVSVTDQGIGISPEHQQVIFEAFGQAESSTTRKYGGTGLGLSISARLVEMLGGTLELTSALGEGSRFYFAIPAKTVVGQAKVQLDSASKHNNEMIQYQGKVLLVEDNPNNQLLMSLILKKFALVFELASDGVEAVEAYKRQSYDLILMDENMPNLNGIEATAQIRQLEQETRRPHTPIVALTANAMQGDRERFMVVGFDDYLAKPLNMPELKRVLAQFLQPLATDKVAE